MTAPLLAPFQNVFPTGEIQGFVFDFTTLFALLVYVFLGYLILQLSKHNFSTTRRTTIVRE